MPIWERQDKGLKTFSRDVYAQLINNKENKVMTTVHLDANDNRYTGTYGSDTIYAYGGDDNISGGSK
ncbi:hypothetical protein [Dapis sp. BLCC M229]|uniref:hypothetical protein n=1 Tax=Dapis sp. BLCC M229 TaxID=3400188 RepID=UPI003CFADB6F